MRGLSEEKLFVGFHLQQSKVIERLIFSRHLIIEIPARNFQWLSTFIVSTNLRESETYIGDEWVQ